MSLRVRFILQYGIGGVLFLALIALLVFSRMEAAMVGRLEQQFENDALVKFNTLEQYLAQRTEYFKFAATIPMFRAMRFHELTLNKIALRDDVRQLELYFLKQQKDLSGLQKVRYIDAKGTELLRIEAGNIAKDLINLAADPEVQRAFQVPEDKVLISFIEEAGQIRQLVWWVPVFTSAQAPQGILSFYLSFDILRNQIQTLANNEEIVCLLNEQEHILASSGTPELCREHHDGDRHWHLEHTLKLPGITWEVLVSTDPAAFLKEIGQLRAQIFGIVLPLAALIVFAVIYITSTRQVRPLRQISEHLKRLAQGELVTDEVHYQGRDEIGELVASARSLKAGIETTIAQANAVAAGDYSREVRLLSKHDQMGRALADMTRTLRDITAAGADDNWLKTALANLDESMRGSQDTRTLTKNIIDTLVKQLDAKLGLFYLYNDSTETKSILELNASYACQGKEGEFHRRFALGEGLVGQAAEKDEIMLIDGLPANYVHIGSGLGNAAPRNLVLVPLRHERQLKGVLEIGSFHALKEIELTFLRQAAPIIAIELYAAESRTRLEKLLAQKDRQH